MPKTYPPALHYPPGTRLRVYGAGGHPDWTGTVVPSVRGHITVRGANGREVTFLPQTVRMFTSIVGRTDSGMARRSVFQMARGRVLTRGQTTKWSKMKKKSKSRPLNRASGTGYRVIVINDRSRMGSVLAGPPSGPALTHRQATTILSKQTPSRRPYIRFLLEPTNVHRALEFSVPRRDVGVSGRRNRIEGRGIDDDAGPRGTGPKRSMTYGVMPPRAEFRKHFNYYVGEGARYKIGNDPIVGYADYSEPELHALVKKFGSAYSNQREGSKAHRLAEEKNSLASAIMETLGFEWI